MYKTHSERAKLRLKKESDERVKAGKKHGLDLVPHKYMEWEVEAEKDRMLDECMDVIGDVRRILKTKKGTAANKIKVALEILGEIEQ